jgi:hypothetical protein
LTLTPAVFLFRNTETRFSEPHAATNSSVVTGTILFARDCQEVEIDNRTGALTRKKAGTCNEATTNEAKTSDPQETMRSRYSGGRLDAIRESFSGR